MKKREQNNFRHAYFTKASFRSSKTKTIINAKEANKVTIIPSRHICCVFESLGTLLDYDHLMITGGTKDLQTGNKNIYMKNLCSTACL